MSHLPALDLKTATCHSPHLVLLGAGASKAALPAGDARGQLVPVMAELASTLGLTGEFREAGVGDGRDFESAYDALATSGRHAPLVRRIEATVRRYFSGLSLPEHCTLYDRLILSLREKDLIATFNWDPFLLQAYRRNADAGRLPQLAFLHGNVGLGFCGKHRVAGYLDTRCPTCRNPLTPSRLLYPVRNKDYSRDPLIAAEWAVLKSHLAHSYLLTVIGYSAPATDVEARDMLLRGWQRSGTFELAEVDIVDIQSRRAVATNWRPFFVREHFGIKRRTSRLYLFRHPRRSCEAFAMASLQCSPWPDNRMPRFRRLDHLHEWVKPLIAEEQAGRLSGRPS